MFMMTPYRNRTLNGRGDARDLFTPFTDSFFRTFFPETADGGFRVDLEDKGDSFVLRADLPGFDKQNVRVEMENGTLTISAKVEEENMKDQDEKDRPHYVFRERRTGSVTRSFTLEGIAEAELYALIDVSGKEAGDATVPVEMTLPPGVSLDQEVTLPIHLKEKAKQGSGG